MSLRPNYRQQFFKHVAQTTDAPLALEIERAEGVYLYGPNGERWLDLISGISVSSMGHSHPRIVKAVQNQAAKYMHTMVYGEFVQGPQTAFAEKLVHFLPDPLDTVYFVNSGSEAVEGALKLAKRVTGRTELISFQNSYHGSTHGALSINGSEYWKNAFRPMLPDVRHIRYGNFEDLAQLSTRTAAVVMETVQGEAGVIVPSKEYIQALRARCTELGIMLILDEIQAGMGRTGKLFGFEHFDIKPDILLLAKAFGGGMPLGAFIASSAHMDTLTHDPLLGHITTFGGHPVCCAAGLAAFELITESNLPARIPALEARFKSQLVHPKIVAFRSFGFLMAVEFADFELNKTIIDLCIEKGVLTDWFLYADNCLRIAPPLLITEKQVDEACRVILESIEEA
ncbi:MAG: acetylornithine/succinyldiaminopimelate/putrescine aminotransferase [Limisphaerales bacterium]|jgi:acetylornithine/succinyldiaminopimelate/putrescine aminotransferase